MHSKIDQNVSVTSVTRYRPSCCVLLLPVALRSALAPTRSACAGGCRLRSGQRGRSPMPGAVRSARCRVPLRRGAHPRGADAMTTSRPTPAARPDGLAACGGGFTYVSGPPPPSTAPHQPRLRPSRRSTRILGCRSGRGIRPHGCIRDQRCPAAHIRRLRPEQPVRHQRSRLGRLRGVLRHRPVNRAAIVNHPERSVSGRAAVHGSENTTIPVAPSCPVSASSARTSDFTQIRAAQLLLRGPDHVPTKTRPPSPEGPLLR